MICHDYPGDINAPIPLQVNPESVRLLGNYGDIVTFPMVNGAPQRDQDGRSIHPEQRYVLVQPSVAKHANI